MKRFYIAERFSFDLDDKTEDNQIVDDDLSALSKKYNYFPKTKEELQNLVDELIEERGNEADLNDIYTGDITDMSGLFSYESRPNIATSRYRHFNGDMSRWDVSSVKDMSKMFFGCWDFNGDISGWDVSKVKNMGSMFEYCYFFNQDLSRWDVSKVKNMSYMFCNCEKFNQDISGWDVSNVENMTGMFTNCHSFNQDISSWDVGKMSGELSLSHICMFSGCPIAEENRPKF